MYLFEMQKTETIFSTFSITQNLRVVNDQQKIMIMQDSKEPSLPQAVENDRRNWIKLCVNGIIQFKVLKNEYTKYKSK